MTWRELLPNGRNSGVADGRLGTRRPAETALDPAARSRHGDAGRREPERRYFWRMADVANGYRWGQPCHATRAWPLRDSGGRRDGIPRARLCRRRGELLR